MKRYIKSAIASPLSEPFAVRSDISKDSHIDPSVLAELAKDEEAIIRVYVAENPNTSPETLELLTNDIEFAVKDAAISNPKLPISILRTLSNNQFSDVRKAIAENKKTPVDVLAKLIKDDYWEVRKAAEATLTERIKTIKSPNTLRKLADMHILGFYKYIAANPNTPKDVKERLLNKKLVYRFTDEQGDIHYI